MIPELVSFWTREQRDGEVVKTLGRKKLTTPMDTGMKRKQQPKMRLISSMDTRVRLI